MNPRPFCAACQKAMRQMGTVSMRCGGCWVEVHTACTNFTRRGRMRGVQYTCARCPAGNGLECTIPALQPEQPVGKQGMASPLSNADDFALLASTPSIVEVYSRANQICSFLVLMRRADGRQLAIASQKSSMTLFTSDTHHSRVNPQVSIGDAVALLNRTPKILGVMTDTHFTFYPHAHDCVKWVLCQCPSTPTSVI